MKSKYIITLIIAAVIATGFSGCSLLRKRVEKTEKVEYKLSAENKSKLVIDNSNGDIKITRTDDTLRYILVEAIKTADVKQDEIDKPIDNIPINVDTTGSLVKIETDIRHGGGMFRKNRSGKVKFNIKVPAGLDVKIDNINGDITLVRISNNIDIETINSSMNLNHCSGNISINGVNGGVHANFDSTKGINIDLVNGIVKLGGMKNISADVDAATTNGKIKFNNLHFDNLIAEKKNLSGTLGKGGSFIKINTVNGNITFDASDIAYKKDIDIGIKLDFGDDDEHIKVEEKNTDEEPYDTEIDHDKKSNEIEKKTDTNKIPDVPKKGDTLKSNSKNK